MDITLPSDLLSDSISIEQMCSSEGGVTVVVPNDYGSRLEHSGPASEVLAIQKLLTVARRGTKLRASWGPRVADLASQSPPLFPLLAVLLLVDGVEHSKSDTREEWDPLLARQALYRYRVKADLFSGTQIIVCADSLGHGRPYDLYAPTTRQLRSKLDFETLVVEVISRLLPADKQITAPYRNSAAIGAVAAELFENTDMHGRFDSSGVPIRSNAIRGLIFKRVHVPRREPKKHEAASYVPFIECLEISVFDTGVGYYQSFTRQPLDQTVPLIEEWQVLHNCLERHYYPNVSGGLPEHRAMGLYEVLRAVESAKGQFEVRTGRLYAYRTFLPGELRPGMEPTDSERPGRPKPKLLDVGKKYAAAPSQHEAVVGTSVRVIVPLE